MRVKMAPQGPEVSRLVYGVWRMQDDAQGADPQRVLGKIQACLDLGITTIDHADIYGGYRCEELFGAALRAHPGLRQRLELVTKCGIMLTHPARPQNWIKHYDYSRQHLIGSVEQSLRNLATDYIDVLLLHRPSPLLDPAEAAEALGQLVTQGKVRHVGVSNFTPAQFDMLASYLPVPLVTNQVELHPLLPAPFLDGTLDHCLRQRILPMGWSPLAGGRLMTGHGEAEGRTREVLQGLGHKYGVAPETVVYAWLLRHPSRILPVIGTNQPERIASAARALSLSLETQDWFAVWRASTGTDIP
ncbi:aldo/keto reductase [Stigmatella sp. ncwal1]|uniref:Aldo/keto reductase n=1 Tax=Stigmatella ashevillensis TaxID=2995309 RepID=A0ABT5DDR4_9BACT|nr:aldo/keto reductase [Stigmatella ashevillena]MDC0711822.1 aldo/keto reductase [Stigmatella ashevillena]